MTTAFTDKQIGDLVIASGSLSPVDDRSVGLTAQALSIAGARREIVFIVDNVPDIDTLTQGVGAGKEVVIIDSSQDGLRQIAEALEGRSNIDALHILSHGASGAIDLGALTLRSDNLEAQRETLLAIGSSMSADGDILFYGCNIGADHGAGRGADLIGQLAIATGADVAASNDLTGAQALGGDWTLELASGDIETAPLVDAQLADHYAQVLKITHATYGFGAAPYSPAPPGVPSVDIAYAIPGQAGYTLNFNGESQAVGNYGSGYLFFASGDESKITINFTGGKYFTLDSLKLGPTSSPTHTVLFSGFNADGLVQNKTITLTQQADFDLDLYQFAGFTNITRLEITSTSGGIKYFMLDDLELSNVADTPTLPAPTITSVSASNANGSYTTGAEILVTVNFDQTVVVSGGAPTLQLETGSSDALAVYQSGTGTSTLTFKYTVAAGHNTSDLNYFSTGSLALGGASIAGTGGEPALLVLPPLNSTNSLGGGKAIVIDTAAPTLSISDITGPLKIGQSATVTFTFSEAPLNFDVSDITYSGGTLGALTPTGQNTVYTATFTPTANTNNGTASISVTNNSYTDAVGNLGSGGIETFTYDTLAPGAAARPVLAAGSDSGAANDGITNDNTPTFVGAAGSAEAGATIRLYVNGNTLIGSQTVAPDGSWEITSSLNLPDNAHLVTAVVTDGAGNAGPASLALSLRVDTQGPNAPVRPDLHPDSDSAVNTDNVTNATVQTLRGLAGSAEAGAELRLYNGSNPTPIGSGTVNPDGSWSIDVTLGEGNHSLIARAVDAAGNVGGASTTTAVMVDHSAPSAPQAPVLAPASNSGGSGVNPITNDRTPTFTGAAGSVENGATVRLYGNDGVTVIATTTAGSNGAWSVATAELGSGAHTITARAFDVAGNESAASQGASITIDFSPPGTTAIGAAFSNDSGVIGDLVTNVANQTISGALSASLVAGERVEVSIDGGATWLPALAAVGSTSWSLATVLSAGNDVLKVRVADAANNYGGELVLPYTYDATAPAAPSTPDLDQGSDTGSSNTDNITGDTTPTFSGSGENGTTVSLYIGGEEIGSAVVTGGSWSITSKALDGGSHQVVARATDAAGNQGPASGPLTIDILTGGPATRVSGIDISADTGTSSADFITNTKAQTISGLLSAPLAAGEVVKVSVDGGANWISATTNGTTWSAQASLVEGENTIMAQVENDIGNAGTPTSQAYTLDLQAPGVTITSDVAPGTKLKGGATAVITFTFSEAPGAGFTIADIDVAGGKISTLSGSGLIYTAIFTPDEDVDNGTASITISAGAYRDLAGNNGAAGTTPVLSFDTKAPLPPPAPTLAAASDTGTVGDGVTDSTTQVIEGGGADADALIRLYKGNQLLGSVKADANGDWSMSVNLGSGTHSLNATQDDKAGNESGISAPFALTISRPTTPGPGPGPDPEPNPNPPTLIDGMQVTIRPVTLPGGVPGTSVSVPIVTSGRNETDGAAVLADIPLMTSGGQTLLLGQLPVGYGLSSAGAIVNPSIGHDLLIDAIRAATPGHAPGDQGHLVDNGISFLDGIDFSQLLVNTVRPVSMPGATTALILSGFNPNGAQGTALVIDTGALAGGAKLELVDIDFSAVVGGADVLVRGDGAIVAGDGASQHFTVGAGSDSALFAGGGNDVLSFGLPVAGGAGATTTTLHGGLGADSATFAGKREDFDIDFHNGYAVVTSKAAPDAKALVVNVEQLQFSDGAAALENGVHLNTLAGMYQTVFGRQADLYGIEFWADHRDAGMSWGTIALELISSSERLAMHDDFNGNPANDIGLLYQALFDRAAEAEGLAYWQAAMERGMSLEQVATSFVESAEMVGHQRAPLDWDFHV